MRRLRIRARNAFVRLVHLILHRLWIRTSHVMSGPFQGMIYEGEHRRSAALPKVLGTYELELGGPVAGVISNSMYRQFLDLGCADGYFLVGVARARPDCLAIGSDISPSALANARTLAVKNGVGDRVTLVGGCDHAQLGDLVKRGTFLFCDIEGAEDQLLDPAKCPQLARADLLIEVHEFMRPGLSEGLIGRFSASHHAAVLPINAALRRNHPLRRTLRMPRLLWALATFEMRNPNSHWLLLTRRSS
jgi:SAM-dependent methyltransferase